MNKKIIILSIVFSIFTLSGLLYSSYREDRGSHWFDICANVPIPKPCYTCEQSRLFSIAALNRDAFSTICKNNSDNGILVDNMTFNAIHASDDYISAKGNPGCFSCGSKSPGNKLVALNVKRQLRSRDRSEKSSFGAGGVFWNYDINLTLFNAAGQTKIDYFNANGMSKVRFDVMGDKFEDTKYQLSKYIELLDATGLRTVDINAATTACLVDREDKRIMFEIFEQDDGVKVGRVTSIKDRNDYGIDFHYLYEPDEAISSGCNDEKWKLTKVTDANNREINLTYLNEQRQGRFVVSEILLPNGETIAYDYGTDEPGESAGSRLMNDLEKVHHPDGTKSTFEVNGVDEITRTIFDASAAPGRRKKTLFLSKNATAFNDITFVSGYKYYNQSSELVWKVENGAGEETFRTHSEVTTWRSVYEGGGKMKQVHTYKTQFYKNWSKVGNVVSGEKEAKFTEIPPSDWAAFHKASPTIIKLKDGRTMQYQYTPDLAVSKKTYPDGSAEEYVYNDFQQVLTHVDRLGRVALNTYDERGNLLINEVGMKLNRGTTFDAEGDALSHFALEESSGSELTDSVSGITATLHGGADLNVPGVDAFAGSAVYLDGVDDHISVPNDGRFDSGKLSFSMWMRPDWIAGSVPYNPLVIGIRDINETRISVHVSSDLNWIMIWNGSQVKVYPAFFQQGQWRHLTATWDGATEKVYLDGQLIGEQANTFSGALGNTFRVGSNGVSEHFKGGIDEIRVHSATLEPITLNGVLNFVSKGDAYSKFVNEYYPAGHQNEHLLKYTYDANNNRTEFLYDNNNLLLFVNEPYDEGNGFHTAWAYTYDSAGRLKTSTDAANRTTTKYYDERSRVSKIKYNDESTELFMYGEYQDSNLLVMKKDRDGYTTKFEYDAQGRRIKIIQAFSKLDKDGNLIEEYDGSVHLISTFEYLDGTDLLLKKVTAGEVTEYEYDYRHRLESTKTYPSKNVTLENKSEYIDNLLFCQSDPHGRKTYYAYRDSDSALIRTVQGTKSSFSLTDFTAVKNLNRDLSNNAVYLITDYALDEEGQTVAVTDPRGIVSTSEYDCQGRIVSQTVASNSAIAATSKTEYDAQSNVIASINARGYKSKYTYTRRNKLASQEVASGTSSAAKATFTYFDDGRPYTNTDYRGNAAGSTPHNHQTKQLWHECCGRIQATIDEEGHGVIYNNSDNDDKTHIITVSDVIDHNTNYHDPINSKTLSEVTNRFDARHRVIATTNWLEPLGDVDEDNPPIAGDPGVNEEGLTTYYEYFDEVVDSSGIAVDDRLDILYQELKADGIEFDGINQNGSAIIVTDPAGEITVSISDGKGRTVITGKISDEEEGAYEAVTWATSTYDEFDNVEDLLKQKSTDALDNNNVSYSDGAGRVHQTEDAENNKSYFEFDANSNLLKARDPNGVGQDCVFDERNRDISCTDTQGDVTSRTYDDNNNVLTQTDAKGKLSTFVYDERDRLTDTTNRIGVETSYEYDENSNLLSESVKVDPSTSQTTNYSYTNRNQRNSVTYPDGGVTSTIFDPARRALTKYDQLNDTVTNSFDLVNRLIIRDYSDGTADLFTYDANSRVLTAQKGRYANLITYAYDEIGRRKSESTTVNYLLPDEKTYTVNHTFDAANRMVQCEYPDGSVVDKYFTARNQLESINYNGLNVAQCNYDAGMREITHTLGNGHSTQIEYGRNDNLKTRMAVAGRPELSYNYAYDPNKNITDENIEGVIADYSWSSVG